MLLSRHQITLIMITTTKMRIITKMMRRTIDNDDDNREDDLKSKVGMQGMMHPRRQQMIPGFSKP